MADVAVGRRRRDAGIRAVTGETHRMTVRYGLERALLQPKIIAPVFRGFGHVLFTRIALRLIGLMTDGATFRLVIIGRVSFPRRDGYEPRAAVSLETRSVEPDDVYVFVVRKTDAEFRDELAPLLLRVINVTETGKEKPAGVARTDVDVTVGANDWGGSLTRKKLLTMAIQTGRVLGKIGHVGKCPVSLAYVLPILRRNLMA